MEPLTGCGSSYRYIVLTGRPGIGKTTIFIRVLEELKSQGVSVEGFVCPEVRRSGRRVGFLIRSLDGRIERWLARIDGCDGPRVGRYYTCMEALDVANYVLKRYRRASLLAVDEIGPMELRLPGLRRIILEFLQSGKPGLYVVHERLRDEEIQAVLKDRSCVFRVTESNRDELPSKVLQAVQRVLRQKSS